MPYFGRGYKSHGGYGYGGGAAAPAEVVIEAGVNDRVPFTEMLNGPGIATIAPATYLTADSLRAALQTAMNDAAIDEAFAATVVGGKLRLARAGDTFTLDFGSSPATSAGPSLGWAVADTPSGLSSTADNALPF